MEGASSGCVALTSIHAENVWEIPDRILNMVGDEGHKGFENDIYTFFDYAIKVKAEYSKEGVKRRIDQICFFERKGKENIITNILKDGKPLRTLLPERILSKFYENRENEFLNVYVKQLEMFKENSD